MESLAIVLMFFIVFLLGVGAFCVGLVCITALMHALRASESPRSARAARWVGLAGMSIGLVVVAVAFTRTGSVGLGALDFNLLAGIGAMLTFGVCGFAFARSWAGPASATDEAADRAATLAVYAKSALGAIAFAIVTTLVVCVIGLLTEA